MSQEHTPQEYHRYLSPVDVWALAFGCMVGWGAFVMPGNTFLPAAGPAGTILSLLLGAAIMMVIALNMTYLMRRYPSTGGIYAYTKNLLGRDHAFISSWFLTVSYITILFLNGTALFLILRTIFGPSFHAGAHYHIAGTDIYVKEVLTSVLALAGVGSIFIFSKPFLQKLHTVLAICLFAGLGALTVICLSRGAVTPDTLFSYGTLGIHKGNAILGLMVLAPWAFVGFEIISFDTAHYSFSITRSNAVIITAIAAAALAYIACAVISVSVVPDGCASWQEYISGLGSRTGVESVPTFYAAKAALGDWGLALAGFTALCAILTGLIASYRGSMRLLSTMAEDQILGHIFNDSDACILFVMALSIILSFLGRNTLIRYVDLTSFGAIVAYGYTCLTAMLSARADGRSAFALLGWVGVAVSVILGLVQLVPGILPAALDPMCKESFLLLSLWCLLGFAFYWRTINRNTLSEYRNLSYSGIILFAILMYSAIIWMSKTLYLNGDPRHMHALIRICTVTVVGIITAGSLLMFIILSFVRKKQMELEHEKFKAENAREKALEGSKAKSRFLFNMSHDIRTPMNAILGYTALARKQDSAEVMKGYLQKIDKSGRHLLDLINDVLEMSRIENDKKEQQPEPVDIAELFDDLRDLFAEQMTDKGLAFTVDNSRIRNRFIRCDKICLNRVLINLLDNSYKFTPAGTVSVRVEQTEDAPAGSAAFTITISDTGIGMSEEFAANMFSSFERERTSTVSGIQGTGLGLSITKSLVELMGGTITPVTTAGKGTTFVIDGLVFPVLPADEASALAGEEADTANADFSGKRLLLVEDNIINMEIAEEILGEMGFDITTADNGQAAIDTLTSPATGPIDLILMDIQMPVMNGYEAARAIRSLEDPGLSRIPIIAMTANAFQEDIRNAMEAGMQGHIAKPIDVKDMTRTIAKVLKEGPVAGA
ncbi:MAG: amino acid permease [Abditibacteriota bacterium]|nr:amino acid permease [Abditibacteriota bacterium]